MAVGSTVELHHDGSSSGWRTITPASGDEYCILRIAVTGNNWAVYLEDEGAGGSTFRKMKASRDDHDSPQQSPHVNGWSCTDVKWYITPTCQLRLYVGGDTVSDWYMTAVKSKD